MTAAAKDKVQDKVATALESSDVEVLRATIRDLVAQRTAASTPPERKGWWILTPIANYNSVPSKPMMVPGTKDEPIAVRFTDGKAFVEDQVAARKLCSDFGYFSEPAFEDIDVRPTYLDPNTREVLTWIDPITRKLPAGSGMPAGYERRYAVRA